MITPLTTAGIRERITSSMDLVTEVGEDQPPRLERPPKWLVQAIYDRQEYSSVRPINGITTSPTIRSDGSILQTEGYDSQSKLVYMPNADYPLIPIEPTQADAIQSAQMLRDLLIDFPFKTSASFAVWLASPSCVSVAQPSKAA